MPLINCIQYNGFLIDTPRGMKREDMNKALNYGLNASEVKKKSLIRKELAE